MVWQNNLQCNKGYRKNLLKISDLTVNDIENIIILANRYTNEKNSSVLQGKTIINLFFENSTRTLASFEIAAKSLGANVLTLPIQSSSINKGEDLKDMIKTLDAMESNFMIIRHQNSGIVSDLAKYVKHSVINAGDGQNEHPTQALADYLVIKNHKKRINGLKVVICGDILHSRVARSNIRLLSMLGAKISLIAPTTLVCKHFSEIASIHYSLSEGINDADVIMLLRLQKERMNHGYFIPSTKEYFHLYGLDSKKILHAKPDVIIMHPGPVNRGTEISSDITDKIILQQASSGIAVRKAIFHYYSGAFLM
ncbi:aspartate carbamoyltransferase [Wolbachia pipientis]|uniref:Aspartate carbamoyltransferase n=1 Tax=Wolbachia pipientis TaxID=955 RepID=A0A1E7QKL9_WOLPI|nr:aspartate carbamoyltransferase catalytic subunit [Wolbachia pipientis]OEY86886.1 aspartate carbamoyltransferase [Wolbachia pipientis]